MPPSYADSFTSSLRETLLLNRSRISEWAEHEKEHVDVLAEQHRARAWKQQTQVDKAVTQYLTMQLHTNCNVVDDDGENSSSQQPKMTTEELMEQAEELKVEIITLRAKLDVKQATIRGKKEAVVRQALSRYVVSI
jgi:ribosomal protein L29